MYRWLWALVAGAALAACSADYDSRYQTARYNLTQDIESGKLTGEPLALAYLKRGYTLQEDKQYDRALADYGQAVTAAPKMADAYWLRADLLLHLGRLDPALADASEVIALKPAGDPAGYLLRGEIQGLRGEHQAAVADFDEAIRRDAKSWMGYGDRGVQFAALGDDDRALADLDRAVALDPGTLGKTTSRQCVRTQAQTTPNCKTSETDIPSAFAMESIYRARGMIWYKRAQYDRAAPDLERGGDVGESAVDAALADFAIGKCEQGRYHLRMHEQLDHVAVEASVAAHRDFIAKTPCLSWVE